jgi:hypothetical protein
MLTLRHSVRRMGTLHADLACLLGLALALTLLAFAIPRLANDRVATGMDQLPARIALDGFYPVERNAAGAYRWAMPTASIATRAEAPGTYRIAITLQEGPSGQSPRAVVVSVNGQARGEWPLTPAPREFVVAHTVAADVWARDNQIVVGISTSPLTIGGDPRTLGPVVTAFRLEQTALPGPWPPPFLIACALILLGGYPSLRLGGLPPRATALGLGLLALGGAAYAALDRPGTLRLLYQPLSATPLWTAALGMAAAATLLFAQHLLSPAAAGTRTRHSALGTRHSSLLDALFIATIMATSIAPYITSLGFYGDDWLFLKYQVTASQQTFDGIWRALWDNVPILRQRPVQMLALIWVYQGFGTDPLPYHVVNGVVLTLGIVYLGLALRALGLPRLLALGAALVYGLLPGYSTDRFWIASWMAVQSQSAFALALLLGLVAVRRHSRRWLIGWGAATLLALLCSLLAYELVLPLLPLGGALIWWRGRRHGWSRAWLGGFLAVHALGVIATVYYKSQVTIRASVGGTLDLLPTIWRQFFKWDYGPYDVGLNARRAVEIGYGDLGLALPRTAWGLADRYPSGGIILVALALGLMIAAYLGRAGAELADRWPAPKWWGGLILAGLLAFALGYAIFLTNTQMQLTIAGIGNRVAIGATLGVALALVGLLGWLALALPGRWRSRGFTGAVALLCCCGFVTFATFGQFWGRAADEQRAILAAFQRHYPDVPPGATFLLDGACPYAGPAQVFESAWDFSSALAVAYNDPMIKADIVTPRLTVEPTQVTTIIYGAIGKQYPYGPQLIVYDYERNAAEPLTDYATAQRYFQRHNPDRSNGCPPGIEGLGVRLLPWGNP